MQVGDRVRVIKLLPDRWSKKWMSVYLEECLPRQGEVGTIVCVYPHLSPPYDVCLEDGTVLALYDDELESWEDLDASG